VNGFWQVEESAEQADVPTESGEVARGGCSFAWNFSVTRPTVLMETERRTRSNLTLSLHQRIARSLQSEYSTGQKPCTALYEDTQFILLPYVAECC